MGSSGVVFKFKQNGYVLKRAGMVGEICSVMIFSMLLIFYHQLNAYSAENIRPSLV